MDGTLIKVDSLQESLLELFKKNPFLIFMALFHLLKGKSNFKSYIAHYVDLNFASIPLNQSVVQYIKNHRNDYEKIHLITGSFEKNAFALNEVLPLFDEVNGTTKDFNLIGKNKADYICQKYSSYDYIGDSSADFHVWEKANKAIYAGSNKRIWKRLRENNINSEQIHIPKKSFLITLIKALRVHQWTKNLLLFVPLILSHNYNNTHLIIKTVLGFFAFSFISSSVYLLNDLTDLSADRAHKTKKFRPIPAGDFSHTNALITTGILLIFGFILSTQLPVTYGITLGIYFIITSAYSFRLKKIAILDVMILATLFTIRLLAGHHIIEITISPWLLTFSIFIFSSLACLKRSTELSNKLPSKVLIIGRGYQANDFQVINQIGVTTGIIASLVMALYLNSPTVLKLYSRPEILWAICPFLLFWIGRLWLLANRGQVHDDPVVYIIKDKVSLIIGLSCLILILLAR
jgi:4-hydroxybenzoate polyprenyltransferase